MGDWLAQKRQGLEFNLKRNLKLSIYALCISGPIGFRWYAYLQPRSLPIQVALDQFLFSPVFLGVFFCYNSAVEGKLEVNFQEKYLTALGKGLCFWPMVQVINFWIVPPRMRLVTASLVGVGWNCWFSGLVHDST